MLMTWTKQLPKLVMPSTVSTVKAGITQQALQGSTSFLIRPSAHPQVSLRQSLLNLQSGSTWGKDLVLQQLSRISFILPIILGFNAKQKKESPPKEDPRTDYYCFFLGLPGRRLRGTLAFSTCSLSISNSHCMSRNRAYIILLLTLIIGLLFATFLYRCTLFIS